MKANEVEQKLRGLKSGRSWIFLFLGASKFQVEFYSIAVTKSRFVFCPRRPSGRKKLRNVCTSQVPSKVKFGNQQSVLATLFKHGLPNLQARISNLQARPCL